FLVRHDHYAVLRAVVVADHAGHGLGHGDLHGRDLAAKINTERILVWRSAPFAIRRPFVDVVAAPYDAEMADLVCLLRIHRRKRYTVVVLAHDLPLRED